MKRVVGYARVSTDKQTKGVSLEAQRAKIEQYATLYDLELVEVIIDAGASAKTLERPGLRQALDMLKAGEADGLLVSKLDRLTRSVVDLGRLIEDVFSKYTLMSVGDQINTTTAAGRMVLNVLMSVSQWEREQIGERTRDAMAYKKRQGERIGRYVQYGYHLATDGKVRVCTAEQSVVSKARQYREGGYSLRCIARQLESDGYANRSGNTFHPSTINAMLREAV